ncbi:MAG TPA: tetratricopeptide repeat protein [Burkholderiales bacterium]
MLVRALKDLFTRGSDSHADQSAFSAGVAAFDAGDHPAAAEHFSRALHADPEQVQAHKYLGGIAFQAGRYREALEHLHHMCRLEPGNPQYHFDAAVVHWKVGEYDRVRQACEAALALAPNFHPAHDVLARLELPGAYYLDVLSMIHSHLRPRTYLEIGVADGSSIALAQPETRAIGVDPEPKIARPLGPRTKICTTTSDDFFAAHDVHAELGGLPVDLAFIDGMHHFEFALRDFINVEKRASPQSTILIHDCYPFSRLTAERERRTTFWSGDIWRLVLLLRKYRPDLRVNVIATAPTGLGVVRGLDPASRTLHEHLDEIVREFLAVDYSVLDADKAGMLALCPNDWEKVKAILQ